MADVSLLFDVLGGGSLSGDSGKLINEQINSIVTAINQQGLGIKIHVDDNSLKKFKEDVDAVSKAAQDASDKAAKATKGVKAKNTLFKDTDVKTQISLQNKYNSVLASSNKLFRDYSAAQTSSNESSRNAYTSLQNAVGVMQKQNELVLKGEIGVEEYKSSIEECNASLKESRTVIQQNGDATKTFGERLKGLADKFSSWLTVSQVIMLAYRGIKQMVTNVIELDTAMTELKKVTDETDETYRRFLNNATERSKELGATISDTVNATADFARLGYGIEDASTLADAAIVYKNVGDGIQDINEASESIISTMQAFGISAEDAMSIVDKFNNVGNNFAISSQGVGEALLRSASAMHAAGNTLDETIALATAANTVIQNPQMVGTTLKTMSMFLRAAKTEAEEAGESTDGMANSVSELRGEILALTGNKVDIQIDENTFKNTTQILRELSSVWSDLSDVSKANITEMIGGKRNANVTTALLENFQLVEDVIKKSQESEGSALRENDKYLESINGHIAKFKATFQELSADVVNSGMVKGVVDTGTAVLRIVDVVGKFLGVIFKIIDGIGGINTVLAITGTYLAVGNLNKILGFFDKIVSKLIDVNESLGALINTPMGVTTAVIAGIIILAKVIDWVTVSAAEARESLNDIKQEYTDGANELKSLNDELQTTHDRLSELEGKNSLSFTEEEEYENLKKQNNELQRKIDLLNAEQEIKAREQNKAFVTAIDKKFDTTFKTGGTAKNPGKDDLSYYLEMYKQDAQKLSDLEEEYRTKLNDAQTVRIYEAKRKSIEIQQSKLMDILSAQSNDLSDLIDGIEYIDEPKTDDDRKVNEWLDFVNDFMDEMAIAIGGDGAKQNAFNRIVDNWQFDDVVQHLQTLGEQGSVTADMLNDPKYDEFIQKLIDVGVISDDSDESLQLIALAFNGLGICAEEASNKIGDVVNVYEEAIAGLDGVKEKIDSVTDSMSVLADIQSAVADGFNVSLEKALEFADTYPEILNNAEVAADGQIHLNEDVVNSLIDGKRAELQADIDAKVAELEAQKAVLLAKRDFAQAQLEIAQNVGDGEGKISKELAVYRINAGNAMAEALIANNIDEATAYKLAAAAMAQNAEEFDAVAKDVCTDVSGNFNQAAYDAALAMYNNMSAATGSINNVTNAAHNAAIAIRGVSSGTVQGSAVNFNARAGSLGGSDSFTLSHGKFNGVDYSYSPKRVSIDNFVSDLKIDLSSINNAISQIDGQISALNTLRNTELTNFSAKSSGGSGSGSGSRGSGSSNGSSGSVSSSSNKTESWFEKQYKEHSHLIDMEQESVSDYLKWLNKAYKEAYKQGIIDLDAYYKYQEEVYSKSKKLVENAKKSLDGLIEYRIDMLKQDIENEKDALDKKLDNLKDFYNKQKDLLKESYDEEQYIDEQAEKRKSISDIESELSMLSYDDSAKAQKKKLELKEELDKAKKDLDEFEKERALDMAINSLDSAYDKDASKIQAEMDALEEKLNDPNALYNQALSDIKNNSKNQLYYMMLMYNRQYGDGKDETVQAIWENAYAALDDYKNFFGSDYQNIKLKNETNYTASHTSGSTSKSSGSASSKSASKSSTSKPKLEKGERVSVKSGAKWYADSYGGGSCGYAKGGTIKYINSSGTHPYNIDGLGWVRKSDIVGYSSGTKSATPGLHSFSELGNEEYIFTSPSDGTRYKMFTGGEKVLNARATDFLYDFATSGGKIIADMIQSIMKSRNIVPIESNNIVNEIRMGDINISGSATDKTVSEIRRAQRNNVDFMLREFSKLNK